jgi:hypothetical protein
MSLLRTLSEATAAGGAAVTQFRLVHLFFRDNPTYIDEIFQLPVIRTCPRFLRHVYKVNAPEAGRQIGLLVDWLHAQLPEPRQRSDDDDDGLEEEEEEDWACERTLCLVNEYNSYPQGFAAALL